MDSSQKNHDILQAVNDWLAVAGENLCDRATAELRKRMCASVEAETHRLEETGLSHELALQQAMGQLGDPGAAKPTLEAKHLTKKEFIQVGKHFLAHPVSLNLVYRKLIPALGIIFLLPVLLLYMVTWGEKGNLLIVEILLMVLLFAGLALLFKVLTKALPRLDRGEAGCRLSQSVRREWHTMAFCVIGLMLIHIDEIIDLFFGTNIGGRFSEPSIFIIIIAFIGLLFHQRACKKLAAKVEAIEDDGFQYVLLPMSRRAVSTPDIR